MAQFFCTGCFARVERDARICRFCGTDIAAHLEAMSYEDRLINALRHPLSEARMGSILTMANRMEARFVEPLVDCARRHEADVVQNLEILRTFERAEASLREAGLTALSSHGSGIIRRRAAQALGRGD